MNKSVAESRRSSTLADKLNRLFRTVHPRGRSEYTNEEVSEAIGARGGPTISAAYLWLLRKGSRDNPTRKHLAALADFFGVPPAYFFDDGESDRIDAELDLLLAFRDTPIRRIALRASGLSEESLVTISNVVERVRQLEGLAEPKPEPRIDEKPRRGRTARTRGDN